MTKHWQRFLSLLLACIFVSCSADQSAVANQADIAKSRSTKAPSRAPNWDIDFPDPAILKTSDGWYYAYASQTVTEDGQRSLLNVQVARSRDLHLWQHLGDALPDKPEWAYNTQKFWAPHVSYHEGLYYMYYSAEPTSQSGLCLAVAVSKKPEGPFVDKGSPLGCGPGFEYIDPMAFDDPQTGQRLLYWGSGFGPIRVQPLAKNRLEFAKGSAPKALLKPQPNSPVEKYLRLLEGTWVVERNGTYYMFISGDSCCEPVHYAVLVARSKSATGPFELMEDATGKPHSIILEASDAFDGPGHNSVIEDEFGRSWILYHAVDRKNPKLAYPIKGDRTVRRVLMVDRLCWNAEWPFVGSDGSCGK